MGSGTTILTAFLGSAPAAEKALSEIGPGLANEEVKLVSAAIVTLEERGGQVHLHLDPHNEDRGPEAQKLLDRLFPQEVLAMPAVGRQAGAAGKYYASIGMETNPFKDLGENLSPFGAAVLVVVEEEWITDIAGALDSVRVTRHAMRSEFGPAEPPLPERQPK